MRAALALAVLIACLGLDLRPSPAADLGLRARPVHRRIATARPWCVIENLGAAVWFCYPSLAACRPHQEPGTSLYCVRDPIWRRDLVRLR